MAVEAPEHIRIGGSMWRLEFYPSWQIPSGGFGECEYNTQTIRVATRGGDLKVLETLCHEIQHAIHEVFDLTTETVALRSHVNEEMIARASGYGWASVWVQNPKLVRFMRELAKCRELGQPEEPESIEITPGDVPVA